LIEETRSNLTDFSKFKVIGADEGWDSSM